MGLAGHHGLLVFSVTAGGRRFSEQEWFQRQVIHVKLHTIMALTKLNTFSVLPVSNAQVVPAGTQTILVSPFANHDSIQIKDMLLREPSVAVLEWNKQRYAPEKPKLWTPPEPPPGSPASEWRIRKMALESVEPDSPSQHEL